MQPQLDALAAGATLITVNNRLARAIRDRHDQACVDTGRKVWRSPPILPWAAWLQRHYEILLDAGHATQTLLTPAQEAVLWERIVRDDELGQRLLRSNAAARSAAQANRLCHDWLLDDEALSRHGGDETACFLAWKQRFDDTCRRHAWLSPAHLPALLQRAWHGGQLQPPASLHLTGFDALTPVQQMLLDTLRELGATITLDTPNEGPQHGAQLLAAATVEEEARLAALWAHARIMANPQANIAIVSPQLEQHRERLTRQLTEVFDPAARLQGHAPQPGLFEFSLGRPLADFASVAQALLLLRLSCGALTLNEIGRLLRSPFIAAGRTEWGARATLDARLRRNGRPRLDRSELMRNLTHWQERGMLMCPALDAALQQVHEVLANSPTSASPTVWAGQLLRLLEAWGWPGSNPDSHEYQQIERLRRLCGEFARLGLVIGRLTLRDAVQRFTQLAGETVFQVQSPHAPLQVLGVLEAGGLSFDALWLLGMDDQQWPPAPAPNPLLPVQLQRDQGLPHASAERELAFARRLTTGLLAAAPVVIASYACQADAREQGPSPLLRGSQPVNAEDLVPSDPDHLRTACMVAGPGTPLPVPQAPPVSGEVGGGSALLGDQAECPFRAMARHRLHAQGLDEGAATPDPRLLGEIVHQALHAVWRELGNSTTLATLEAHALTALVANAVGIALTVAVRQRPDIYTPTFTRLEQTRLQGLILDWLAIERGREQAFTVVRSEQDDTIEIAGLRLQVRADRVDRLATGGLVVIDYKTGRQSPPKWTRERLAQPQVPLYCIAANSAVDAALIAQVRRDGSRFHGVATSADIAPGIKAYTGTAELPTWDALLTHWRHDLQVLAGEVAAGHAAVSPLKGACEYCDLTPLCRILEQTPDEHEDVEDTGDAA